MCNLKVADTLIFLNWFVSICNADQSIILKLSYLKKSVNDLVQIHLDNS